MRWHGTLTVLHAWTEEVRALFYSLSHLTYTVRIVLRAPQLRGQALYGTFVKIGNRLNYTARGRVVMPGLDKADETATVCYPRNSRQTGDNMKTIRRHY